MMKKIITTLCLFGAIAITSAQNINNYKYILVPETYEFLGKANEYQLNALTKFLFEQEGYNTLMTTAAKPQELAANSCLGLKTRVLNNSGLFVTKLVIELEDCYGNTVFTSKEGRSREKEFQRAYHEALRDAFTSFEEMDYQYVAAEKTDKPASVVVSAVEPVKPDNSKAETVENAPKISYKEETSPEIEGIPGYQFAGKNYVLKSNDQGYGLYQEDSTEPIAMLIETESGSSFIYNSLTNQGIAYFDSDKNLIVEYFSRQENKKVALKYELID